MRLQQPRWPSAAGRAWQDAQLLKVVMRGEREQLGSILTEATSLLASDLFDQAEAYWLSAVALDATDVQSELASQPVRHLYYVAIELYLKAYLRLHGHTLDELDGKFRNDFRRIRRRCEAFGLKFAGSDKRTLEYFIHTPVCVRTKFSTTHYYSAPALSALNDLCCSLHERIHMEIGSRGHVRVLDGASAGSQDPPGPGAK
jgi:hypothetical protein